jgi:hypothetical protein
MPDKHAAFGNPSALIAGGSGLYSSSDTAPVLLRPSLSAPLIDQSPSSLKNLPNRCIRRHMKAIASSFSFPRSSNFATIPISSK